MATKRAKGSKKVKDLDPKAKSADVKGGRDVFTRKQKEVLRRVTKRATDIADEIRG